MRKQCVATLAVVAILVCLPVFGQGSGWPKDITSQVFGATWSSTAITRLGTTHAGSIKLLDLPAKTVVEDAFIVFLGALPNVSGPANIIHFNVGTTSTGNDIITDAGGVNCTLATPCGISQEVLGSDLMVATESLYYPRRYYASWSATTPIYLYVTSETSIHLNQCVACSGSLYLITRRIP
jgi:hypothetical protein